MMAEEKLKIENLFERCCGCGACAATCPVGAIKMTAGSDGCAYPVVDHEKCIGCHRCESVCPALNVRHSDAVEATYWAHDNSEERLMACSSGGVFGALAKRVLAEGGVVCGAEFDEDFSGVRHVVVDRESDLAPLLRSKYVQSVIAPSVYKEIKKRISAGQLVLFSGTACQVAAVRGYLGKHASSGLFVAVDVICHGVPSPGIWSKWLAFRQRDIGGVVSNVSFRRKDNGWSNYSVSIETSRDDGTRNEYHVPFTSDWYMKAFLANASLRGSCFQCPSKRMCGSDITLGDFWGVENCHPEALGEYGVSAVVCNTEKGRRLFESIANDLSSGNCEYGEILAGNPSLENPSIPYAKRDEFLRDVLSDEPMTEVCSRWTFKDPLGKRAFNKVRRVAGALLKRIK